MLVFPEYVKLPLGLLHALAVALAVPVAMHVNILGVQDQGGARFVQGTGDIQAVTVGIGKDGPFHVYVAIFPGVDREGFAGLGMHPEGNAHVQIAVRHHPGEEGDTTGHCLGPCFWVRQGGVQRGGQVFFCPGQNSPDVLRLQVGTDNESHGALAADER